MLCLKFHIYMDSLIILVEKELQFNHARTKHQNCKYILTTYFSLLLLEIGSCFEFYLFFCLLLFLSDLSKYLNVSTSTSIYLSICFRFRVSEDNLQLLQGYHTMLLRKVVWFSLKMKNMHFWSSSNPLGPLVSQ